MQSYLASRHAYFHMQAQALAGIQFNREAARSLIDRAQHEMDQIAREIEPRLPPRQLNKGEQKEYTVPAKPFKKDGTLSAVMLRWCERHGVKTDPPMMVWPDGRKFQIIGGFEVPVTAPMTLANQDALKEWLQSQGWKPSYWNVKKDERGKPVRDKQTGEPIRTSPKMQENGRLCPDLEEMSGELVRPIVRWLSLRNRASVVAGWLDDPRLDVDGRLSAGAAGFASSHRFRHTTVVNVPKAEDGVTLGKEMRALFTARPGRVLVGYDASGLEARVEGHFCTPYDDGVYVKELIEGDIHMKTVEGVFFDKVSSVYGTEDFHKDHPVVKPWRSKSKTLKYASTYGASARKLAGTLGVSQSEGQDIYDRFWEAAKPLALLKEKLEKYWETEGEKKWIKAIDGTRLYSRSRHSLVNLLFQSAGAKVMDYSWLYMDKWLGGLKVDSEGYPCYYYKGHTIYRVLYQHDEYGLDVPEEIADEVGEMATRSVMQSGKYLKFRVPLAAEYKVGRTWCDTH